MEAAVSLYSERKSYVDHPEREKLSEDRKFKDWSGVFRNPRYVPGEGIFADAHLRKTSEYFEGIIEAAQQFPNSVGFSHVADGESRYEGETEIVESIREVFSVDLVTDPATTAGFFESKRQAKPRTIRQAIESLPEGPHRTRLIEMAGAYYDVDVAVDDDKPADPLTQAFSLVKELVAQLGEALKAMAMKKEQPPAPQPQLQNPTDDNAPEVVKARVESLSKENAELKTENARLKAQILLLESGREATDIRVKTLAALEADEDRTALLESWQPSDDAERPQRSPALLESEAVDFPRGDSAKFAASLR